MLVVIIPTDFLNNSFLCQGTVLFYNLYSIYNDKDYWKDPETFRPERFLTENGEIDQSKSERIMNTVFGLGNYDFNGFT